MISLSFEDHASSRCALALVLARSFPSFLWPLRDPSLYYWSYSVDFLRHFFSRLAAIYRTLCYTKVFQLVWAADRVKVCSLDRQSFFWPNTSSAVSVILRINNTCTSAALYKEAVNRYFAGARESVWEQLIVFSAPVYGKRIHLTSRGSEAIKWFKCNRGLMKGINSTCLWRKTRGRVQLWLLSNVGHSSPSNARCMCLCRSRCWGRRDVMQWLSTVGLSTSALGARRFGILCCATNFSPVDSAIGNGYLALDKPRSRERDEWQLFTWEGSRINKRRCFFLNIAPDLKKGKRNIRLL